MVEEHRRHFPRAPVIRQRHGERARHEPVLVLVGVAIRGEIAGECAGRGLCGLFEQFELQHRCSHEAGPIAGVF